MTERPTDHEYDCPLCDSSTTNLRDLQSHVLNRHSTHDILAYLVAQHVADRVDREPRAYDPDPELRDEAPFASVHDDHVYVTIPADDAATALDVVVGRMTPTEARSLTMGIRACAASIDDEPFFAGGWSDSAMLRHAAQEIERGNYDKEQ